MDDIAYRQYHSITKLHACAWLNTICDRNKKKENKQNKTENKMYTESLTKSIREETGS